MTVCVCDHLQPLADALLAQGIDVSPCESPYGDDGRTRWWICGCTFDEKALRARLGLAASLEYSETFAFAAGAEATWHCREHAMVFMGAHPRVAGHGVPRAR